MTVAEYNKKLMKIGSCSCLVEHLDEIVEQKNITRLVSLVDETTSEILKEALACYKEKLRKSI